MHILDILDFDVFVCFTLMSDARHVSLSGKRKYLSQNVVSCGIKTLALKLLFEYLTSQKIS